jgi:hypothetical protein
MRPSVSPHDRATPVAPSGVDYAAYIGSTAEGRTASPRSTMRIGTDELDRLVEQTRLTTANPRPTDAALALAAAETRRRRFPWIGAVALVAGGAALWFGWSRVTAPTAAASGPAGSAGSPVGAVVASAPVDERTGLGASPPPVTGAAAPVSASVAESRAREALDRLRGGLKECIRHGIHGLPGSSPAVPVARISLSHGPYTAAAGEWKTPVWSCAHFQVTEPMPFQIQWQLVRPGVEGLAIAWIDEKGDGTAARALGFKVTLGAKGEPSVGDVEPVDAARSVLVVR